MRDAVARTWPTLLVAGACLGLAASNAVHAPPLALALLALPALVSPRARLVALAAVLTLAGWWWGSARLDALDRSVLVPELGRSGPAEVVVTGPARRSEFSVRVPARVRRFAGLRVDEAVQLELPTGRSPPQGAILELVASIRAPRGPEHGFDERGWLARRGVHVVLRGGHWRVVGRRGGLGGIADRLRGHVAEALAPGLEGERRAVIAGVVLGEDEGLSDELRDAFRASGLYHLLAVSGQNIAFLLIGVYGLAALLAVSRRPAQLLFLGVVAAYVLAVGWQPSVVRAGVAGVLASLAWLLARPGARWHFLALGALVLLAWTPATLLEPGFQLSFAAVGAIFVLAPRAERVLAGYPVPTRLASVLAVSAVCGAVTAPIAWLHFGTVPLYTVPANAVAWPVTAPLLGLGLLAAVIEPVVPAAAVTLGWLNGWLAAYLVWCARLFAGLPYARVSSGAALLALTAAAGVVAAANGSARARWTLGFTVGLAALLLAWTQVPRGLPPPPTGLRVTFLDVGQGDSALLQVPEGAVLVDEGPPEAHVATRLRALGVGGLSLLVLTHPQRDHVGGAEEVLRELRVRALLDPALPFASPYEQRALAVARRRAVPLSLARSGGVYRLGRLVLRVLWPDAAGPPGEDPNDHAIVLLASYGAIDVLLTADAESNVTARLPLRPVEVLKVAHHGSADPGLRDGLRVLRPRIAVISVGAGNDYGHPRRSTLAALEAVPGLRLYRTDLQGEVVVETDGRLLSVRAQR